ncbi:MAG: LPS export ABC transporter ATP-binding protein [Sphaerochaeta sp.]|nr:LPS export ABC transporter ATP-binding protein [Sphaerochaeta sp.]MDX9914265.1 LPS export ABC transporter ATP-binding protein [Sphaerochaeta sp.]
MGDNILEVRNLVKFYGRKQVVKDVSFSMRSGEIIGLLGPNGAGKTTSFYMIVGFLKSKGGSIILNGEEISSLPMHLRSRKGLSYLPQEPSIFRKLTVEENIRLVAESRDDLSGREQQARVEALLEEFGIQEVRHQKGYTLSGGERRRCEIARCLAADPKFLLLDEPFAGIDPKAVYEIKSLITTMAKAGIGILLTDHNVIDTLSITTTSHIINAGSILVSGTRKELLANKEAREIYFGSEFGERV